MSKCNKCGQDIEWKKTWKGANMPIDEGEVTYQDLEIDQFLITNSGDVVKKVQFSTPEQDKSEGWMVHFSTCPNKDDK